MLVATGVHVVCYWSHPQGMAPNLTLCKGWPGWGGHRAQRPGYTATWPQVLAVEKRLTPPSSGYLETKLPPVF